MNVLALDIGGTKVACGTYSKDGRKLRHQVAALEKRTGTEVGDLIAGLIRDGISDIKKKNEVLSAVGISVPGIYYPDSGTVWAPNIPGWEAFPLLKEISRLKELQTDHIKIDSDRACYILGETWQGCARGCTNAIFMAVGTGIGAGILADGKILRGQNDIAGAIGWLTMDRFYRPAYKSYGHFEYYASGEGLIRLTHEMIEENPGYTGILKTGPLSELSTPDLFKAFDQGDEIAISVLERAVSLWGMAAANLVSLFNPEVIIFGGGVFGPAVRFIDRIRKEMELWAQPVSVKKVRLESSQLGSEAGMAGAAFLALQSLKK